MYKQDLALNNLQGLIGLKTQPTNQPSYSIKLLCPFSLSLYIYIYIHTHTHTHTHTRVCGVCLFSFLFENPGFLPGCGHHLVLSVGNTQPFNPSSGPAKLLSFQLPSIHGVNR